MTAALPRTVLLSVGLLPALIARMNDLGAVSPADARIAAAEWWAPAWLGVSVFGVLAAVVVRRRPHVAAAVLTWTSVLSVGAAAFTLFAVLHLWVTPLDLRQARTATSSRAR